MPRANSFSDSEGRSLTPELQIEVDVENAPFVHSPTPLAYSPRAPSHRQPFSLLRTTSKKTLNSIAPQSPTVRTVKWENLTPKDRFRAVVNRVIVMHRGLSMLTVADGSRMRVGAEPGVDPRHASAEATYGHRIHPCRIEIVDYSAIRNVHRVMSNDEFVELMDTDSDGPPLKPPWAKVRWINIGGLSWDVIKAVSIKYGMSSFVLLYLGYYFWLGEIDLHPLALEDVFHGHARNRSKADYYTNHLFLRVLCHQLVHSQGEHDSLGTYITQRYTTSPEPMLDPAFQDEDLPKKMSSREHSSSSSNGSISRRPSRHLLPLNRADTYTTKENFTLPLSNLSQLLKKENAVSYDVMSIFIYFHIDIPPRCKQHAINTKRNKCHWMFWSRYGYRSYTWPELLCHSWIDRMNGWTWQCPRCLSSSSEMASRKQKLSALFIKILTLRTGTVVSLQSSHDSDLTSPISQRLRSRDTVLTKSADPSLLVHALLDLSRRLFNALIRNSNHHSL